MITSFRLMVEMLSKTKHDAKPLQHKHSLFDLPAIQAQEELPSLTTRMASSFSAVATFATSPAKKLLSQPSIYAQHVGRTIPGRSTNIIVIAMRCRARAPQSQAPRLSLQTLLLRFLPRRTPTVASASLDLLQRMLHTLFFPGER